MTTPRRRIGANMRQAVAFVQRHPGCSIAQVARHLYPNYVPHAASLSGGFQTVHRCIAQGLLADADAHRRKLGDRSPYSLALTPEGLELASTEVLWERRRAV